MPRTSRRSYARVALTLALSLVLGVLATAVEPIGGPTSASAAPVTFSYTGAPQVYQVPSDISYVAVHVYGASGGAPGGTTGAAGDHVWGIMPVPSGGFLQINVGGAGTTTGGWNGGGDGYGTGFGGGGASDISMCSTASLGGCNVTERRVVAGGGGGAIASAIGSDGGGLPSGAASDPSAAGSGGGGMLTNGGVGASGTPAGESGGQGYGGHARSGTDSGGGGSGLFGGGGGTDGPGGGGSSCASVTGDCTATTNELTKSAPQFQHAASTTPGDGSVVVIPVPDARTAQNEATPPVTANPTNIVATSAEVHGAVNPHDLAATPVVFHGTSAADVAVPGTGTRTALTSASAIPLTGTSFLSVSGTITGLSSATTYYYRVCAETAEGTTCGSTQSFSTMIGPATPAVDDPTVDAATVTDTSADFASQVTNPGTGPTAVTFECSSDNFATIAGTGSATPASVTGVSPIAITGQCTGLTAGTMYKARLKATNTVGPGVSATPATFTTMSTPSVAGFALTSGSVASSYAAFSGSVNPASGTSTAPTSISVECSTSSSFSSVVAGSAAPSTVTGTSPVSVTGSCMALSDDTDYWARIVVTNAAGSGTSSSVTFRTTAIVAAPTVTNPTVAAGPFGTSVDLTGAVTNPGHGPTNIYFECSKASDNFAPGTIQLVQANPASATGLSSVTVTGSCINLASGTAYKARIKAVNSAAPSGVVSATPLSFTTTAVATAPVVAAPSVALDISNDPILGETTATIEAAVTDPGLGPTSVVFEVSPVSTFPSNNTQTVTAYTSLSPLTPAGNLSGSSSVSITTQLTGLTPGTGYYVRVKATNPAAASGVTSVPAFFTTYTYAITPTLGTLSVQNGSVTASAAGFSGTVTNPGSSTNLAGTSTVTVALQCSHDTFSTVVAGTVTGGPFSGRTSQAVTGSCASLTGATAYQARLAVTATPTDPADAHYSLSGGVPQPYTVYSNVVSFTTAVTQTLPVVANPSIVGSPTTSSADVTVDITNPGGGPTTVLFECATSQTFTPAGSIVFTAVGANSPVSGNTLVAVTATCASLTPNTQYWVRVKATNGAGTGESDWSTTPVTFTTAPSVGNPVVTNAALASVTAPAVNPAYTSITLTGTLTDPAGAAADVYFECSTDAGFTSPQQVAAYLASSPSTAATAQTTMNTAVVGECTGLADATTYYVRLKASNSNGIGYSPSQLIAATPAYVHSPVLGQVTVVSRTVNQTSVPYTTTKASFAASITDPGVGPTTIAFECSTDSTFPNSGAAPTITGTNIVGSPASGRAASTVTGECVGLLPDENYYVRVTGTNTPTDPADSGYSLVSGVPQPNTVLGSTITVNVVAFTTVPIVVAPVFSTVTPPTPTAGTPSVPTITAITAVGSSPGTTQVTGAVQSGTTVTVTVNGIDRTAGSSPTGVDACTVTGATYVCILDPQVAAGATVRVTSTDPTTTPSPLSSHTDAVVPANGTTPIAPAAQVLLVAPQLPEKVTLKSLVNPGVGPTAVVFVYSTNPLFGTASHGTVPSGDLVECSTGPSTMTGTTAANVQQTCLGLPDANETYWARAKATNTPTDGTTAPVTVWSNALMFTTIERTWAPTLPLGITLAGATDMTLDLSAIVDPGNLPTTVTFECATDAAFTNIVDTVIAPQSPVSGKTVRPTTATCTGLTIATTYYVRVSVVNALGNADDDTTAPTTSIPVVVAPAPAAASTGGGAAAPSVVLGPLGPFPPTPFVEPGKRTVQEDGTDVPSAHTPDADSTRIAGADYSVTFRGLDTDREVLPTTPAPESSLLVGCQGFVQVSGNGFMPSSTGRLHMYGTGDLLTTIPVTTAGSFSVTVRLPDEVKAGPLDLQLNAYSRGLKVRSVTVGAIVGACPPPPAVLVTGRTLMKTVQHVYFDPFSYDLDTKSRKALRKLVRLTSRTPLKVKAVGYAQGQGTPLRGRILSEQRAGAVLDFLREQGGMHAAKAVAKGANIDGNFGPDRYVQITVFWTKQASALVPATADESERTAAIAKETARSGVKPGKRAGAGPTTVEVRTKTASKR